MKCNEIIYNLRKSRKLEQTKVAADLGVSREILNHWESGTRQIKAEHIVKLANYYNVSADYILGLSPHETVSADLDAVCDYTGLSVDAVNNLVRIAKAPEYGFLLSPILETREFKNLISDFALLEENRECVDIRVDYCKEHNITDHEAVEIDTLPDSVQALKYGKYQIVDSALDLLDAVTDIKTTVSKAEDFLRSIDYLYYERKP